jgi:hypothetical protein
VNGGGECEDMSREVVFPCWKDCFLNPVKGDNKLYIEGFDVSIIKVSKEPEKKQGAKD